MTVESATLDVTVSEDVPMLHEVTSAIRRLKNSRAAGANGINAELLRGAENPISEALHKVITNVWSMGRVPAEWKEGIIVSVYKGKVSQSECSSYRPIFLLFVSGKVFAHNSGAHSASTSQVPQTSTVWFYCRAVYTMDAILALRLLAELHRNFNRQLHVHGIY